MTLRELMARIFVFDEDRSEVAEETPSPPIQQFDLADIYRKDDIPAVPFTAEQAAAFLATLPEGPPDWKLKGLEYEIGKKSTSVATVAGDARRKVDALTNAADGFTTESSEFVTSTEEEIAALEAQIREKQEAIRRAKGEGEQIIQLCRAEAERLKALLQFLGL